jgi:hypothetical protein
MQTAIADYYSSTFINVVLFFGVVWWWCGGVLCLWCGVILPTEQTERIFKFVLT